MRRSCRARILKLLFTALVGAGFGPSTSVAQEADAAALAKAAQNPLASVISLPIQWNSNFSMGAEDRTQNVILLQPVLPFSLGSKLTLITRHILPIVNQPAITGDGPAFGPIIMPPGRPPDDFDRATGLGDYSGTFWLSSRASGKAASRAPSRHAPRSPGSGRRSLPWKIPTFIVTGTRLYWKPAAFRFLMQRVSWRDTGV